ncbi:ATP-dependent DNA ligase [Amycolatopsis rubida]|uniref:DNA ligase (ATP) n=1 Tax=Amycolatopsis rubida TaxID=112413 RepID=A0A1I5KD50_9PSEU|nr:MULTISPECIES: non-homologous end-joining DNA ligase [Amycolatopsis]MYW97632.1 ATP-dependent DNA ligase [Amycolatopsis rubida]NEC62617.1 ATP-dependent DNA ligase [Amycolatopsis rubida]OAP21802.1 putative DNA ligase-like protein [Amycolatopsis sp. M39]SFO82965.1 DNA ligase D [Amycolatopsis rubida]
MTGPGWREPALATLTDRRFSDEGWIYERKLDGVRAICVRDSGTPTLYSRNRKVMDNAYPEIVEALAAQGGPRFVADGEIVAFDGGQTSFAALQPRIHLTDPERARATGVRVYYYLFDLLYYDEQDTTPLPLRQRKSILRDAFAFDDPLRLSAHRNTEGEKYFEDACRRGWEGVIAKRADAPYHGGRSPDWLKFKCQQGQEMVIGGFTAPQGSRVGFGALLLGYHEKGQLRYAGKVGTGFGHQLLTSLHAELARRETGSSPFADRVREPGAHWVRPELVAQIGFSEWTRDGRLRHPRFTGLRHDKKPSDVIRERP